MENLSAFFLLRPDVCFLNHGSFGACPSPVFEDYQRWQLQLESQPVAFLDPARGLSGWMREARVALAAELGEEAAAAAKQKPAPPRRSTIAERAARAPQPATAN